MYWQPLVIKPRFMQAHRYISECSSFFPISVSRCVFFPFIFLSSFSTINTPHRLTNGLNEGSLMHPCSFSHSYMHTYEEHAMPNALARCTVLCNTHNWWRIPWQMCCFMLLLWLPFCYIHIFICMYIYTESKRARVSAVWRQPNNTPEYPIASIRPCVVCISMDWIDTPYIVYS